MLENNKINFATFFKINNLGLRTNRILVMREKCRQFFLSFSKLGAPRPPVGQITS